MKNKHQGYVLIFTLWILAVATATLSFYMKNAGQAPQVIEAHLKTPLALQQMMSVIDTLPVFLRDSQIAVDPRWVVQQKIAASRRGFAGLEPEELSVVTETLEQLGFKVEIKAPTPEENIARLKQSLAEAGEEGEEVITLKRTFTPQPNPYTFSIRERVYKLTVWPVNTRPNLNYISEEDLERYLENIGFESAAARELTGVLIDWRDENKAVSRNGAETAYYQGLTPSYAPPNREIKSWYELNYIKGGSPELTDFLRQHFVIHSKVPGLNFSYVEPAVLAKLTGLSEEKVEEGLNAYRRPRLNTLSNQQLRDIVGIRAAENIEQYLTREVEENAPVFVKLEGPQHTFTGIFDVEKGEYLEQFLF